MTTKDRPHSETTSLEGNLVNVSKLQWEHLHEAGHTLNKRDADAETDLVMLIKGIEANGQAGHSS